MHVSSRPVNCNLKTYAEDVNLNWPYVWLPWCQKVFLFFLDLFQVRSYAKRCVSLHVHILCLQQLQLLERYVVGDAGRKPSIAHRGRVERDV